MKLQEIKAAVESGKTVCVGHDGYEVIKDKIGQWLIHHVGTDYYIGLTWMDGVTMNAKPEDCYIKGKL